MFPHPRSYQSQRLAAGFSLVEIMVGMVIGMLGLVIMMQVFSLSEGQKRTTTGGGDAQSSGMIALYGLQRDLRQAGFGITDLALAGCNLRLRAGVTLNNLAPITINHPSITGQDANTDTLLMVYGNSNGAPQGDRVTAQPTAPGFAVPDIYATATPSSFTAGDRVIATPQNRATPQCDLALATAVAVGQVATGNAANVAVTAGTGVDLGKVGGAGVICTAGVCGAFAGGQGALYNLGPVPRVMAYAIRGGNLTVCDYMVNNCGAAAANNNSTVWVSIASNIASLKAQYGRDTMLGLNPLNTTMDGVVDRYDNQTPAANVATNACDWMKISAVRVALVARNGNYEKDIVTTTANAPAWEGSVAYTAPNPPTATDRVSWAASPIVLTANTGLVPPATWQHYRYKVLQTVVPLRNLTLAWQGVTCTS